MKYPYMFGLSDEELEANRMAEKPRPLVFLADGRVFYQGVGRCDDSGPQMQIAREICDIYRNIDLSSGVCYLTNLKEPHAGQIHFEGFPESPGADYFRTSKRTGGRLERRASY